MIYRKFKGKDISILALGTMRLPVQKEDNQKIHEEEAIKLIREAIDQGINYVDTAYMYHGGDSEPLVGKALRDGYREKVTLVTKLPTWSLKQPEDMDKILNDQLEKLQTDHLDIYLLHAMERKYWDKLLQYGIFEFIEKIKADGRVKYVGFSFHDDAAMFDEIIEAYPWDICMIQMNFVDQETQATLSGLEKAGKLGIPVAIMEPLKGGQLTNPPTDIASLWSKMGEDRSAVEWSFRWLANRPEVLTILSGMSDQEQLKENLEIAERMTVNHLSETQLLVFDDVRKAYDERIVVKCTQCNYCMPCPFGVDIPKNFKWINETSMYNQYSGQLSEKEKASQCQSCGVCEEKCPQQIRIMTELKNVDAKMRPKTVSIL